MKKLPPLVSFDSLSDLNDVYEKGQLNGLFRVPNEIYHDGPGISSTGLKKILRSPAHFRYSEHKETTALTTGTLIHESILEPELFAEKYFVMPKVDRRTKAGKEQYAAYMEKFDGMEPIDDHTMILIEQLREEFHCNKYCSGLIKKSVTEVAAYTVDEETGLLLKAKADILHVGKIYAIADLKTCEDARERAVKRDILKYYYDLSAAFYIDVFEQVLQDKVSSFMWTFIEKQKPYGIANYIMNDNIYEFGRRMYRKALRIYKECLDRNEWPGYPEELMEIKLPEREM